MEQTHAAISASSGGHKPHMRRYVMKYRTRRRAALLAIASGSIALSAAQAAPLTEVPNPNPKLAGVSAPTLLSPELRQSAVAEGAVRLENPTTGFEFYGFSSDGPHLPVPGALPGTSGPI